MIGSFSMTLNSIEKTAVNGATLELMSAERDGIFIHFHSVAQLAEFAKVLSTLAAAELRREIAEKPVDVNEVNERR